MRQYLAAQAYGPGAKGLTANMMSRSGANLGPFGNNTFGLNADLASGKVSIQHFACRSLSIGTWRRVGQSTMDLVIFYAPEKACITYYINNENAGYKIEYPFAWIKNIFLEQGDVLSAAEGASQRAGGLLIELTRPPKFYMDSPGSGGFYECGDFTEEQQATQIMMHSLGGPSKVLSGQLAKLISLESYQNRHNVFDPAQFAVSAPVSPMRPASQPNHMVHPHPAVNMFHQEQPMVPLGLMGPPAPRGHKRQRSRSVPAAIDLSMLRHPMPSFLIQHEPQSAHPIMQDPNIFAPIPQHNQPMPFAPGPMGPNLSIDTSGGYGMNLGYAGPMSAGTANSPSEFGTPAFFTSAPPGDAMHPTHFNNPFNPGFLSVDQAAMIGTSNTPLSMTHGDPAIADHSPPLSGIGRSQSADIFGTPSEHSQYGDDSIYLSESFNKQIQLPFRSPMPEDAFHALPDGSYHFQTPPGTSGSQTSMPMDNNSNNPHNQMPFDCPPPPPHDGSMIFQSPPNRHIMQQHHQDSGVAFSTPSHLPPDSAAIFDSPKDHSSLLYQDHGDAKLYTSPGQIQPHLQDEQPQHVYQHSPLVHGYGGDEYGLYNTIDPHSLGQHSQQH